MACFVTDFASFLLPSVSYWQSKAAEFEEAWYRFLKALDEAGSHTRFNIVAKTVILTSDVGETGAMLWHCPEFRMS